MTDKKFVAYFEYDPEVEAMIDGARNRPFEEKLAERIVVDWYEFTHTGILGWFLDFFRTY